MKRKEEGEEVRKEKRMKRNIPSPSSQYWLGAFQTLVLNCLPGKSEIVSLTLTTSKARYFFKP